MDNPLQAPVLVLNANFEPLNVCNTRRAIVLVLTGKANLILDGRGEIHSVSHVYPCPSIIRLERMIKRPRPQVKLTKREILQRDNYICQYCNHYYYDCDQDEFYYIFHSISKRKAMGASHPPYFVFSSFHCLIISRSAMYSSGYRPYR